MILKIIIHLIYISFKDVKKFSWESCYNKTIGLIKNIFKEFLYLAHTLNEIDKLLKDRNSWQGKRVEKILE